VASCSFGLALDGAITRPWQLYLVYGLVTAGGWVSDTFGREGTYTLGMSMVRTVATNTRRSRNDCGSRRSVAHDQWEVGK
jgi:hypothetical protein